MDQAQWLTCTNPAPMLKLLWSAANERQIRLFEVACCRSIWHLLPDKRSQDAVRVAERYADAEATEEELEKASDAAWDVCRYDSSVDFPYRASLAAYNVALLGWWEDRPRFVFPHDTALEVAADRGAAGTAQCSLLRDILGNPFRPILALAPVLLTSNGGLVVKLAQAAYEDRILPEGRLDNARLAVLADALEEAGFQDAAVLSHLRQPDAVHVRGCAVVDYLLGF